MSRNLCSSFCTQCGYHVRLSDLRGKPIEFRRYRPYCPTIGCRFDCACGTSYFAMYRHHEKYWGDPRYAFEETLNCGPGVELPNTLKGKFVLKYNNYEGEEKLEETGCYTVDLSYYESYNDEPVYDEAERAAIKSGEKPPWHLCMDDAEEHEWVWGEKP